MNCDNGCNTFQKICMCEAFFCPVLSGVMYINNRYQQLNIHSYAFIYIFENKLATNCIKGDAISCFLLCFPCCLRKGIIAFISVRTMTSALVLYISRLITTKEELLIILLACLVSKFSCSCLVTVSSLSAQADEALYEPGPKLTRATGVTPARPMSFGSAPLSASPRFLQLLLCFQRFSMHQRARFSLVCVK